jgi:IBR domain, a half RING-finger domain
MHAEVDKNTKEVVKMREKSFETDTLEKKIVDHYLQHAEDVRKCPKATCKYSGFLPQNSCSAPLQCKKCKTTWQDPALYPFHIRMFQEIKSLLALNSSHFTHLRTLFFEEPCPKCGVLISKNGGCEHMVCGRCKYEFCWLCLGAFYSYQHNDRAKRWCPYRYMAVQGFFFVMLFITGAKFGYAWEFFGKIIFPLYYHAFTGALMDLHLLATFIIIVEFGAKDINYDYQNITNYRNQGNTEMASICKRRFIIKVARIILISGVLLSLMYFYWYFSEFSYTMVSMIFYQLMAGLIGFLCYFLGLAFIKVYEILCEWKRKFFR